MTHRWVSTSIELDRRVKWSGIDDPPPVDIKALIDSMPDQVAFQPMKPGDR